MSGWLTPRVRTILAWVCLGLAVVILLVSSVTVWVKSEALDSDAWADVSGDLIANDAVRAALSEKIVTGLFSDPEIAAQLQTRLPPVLQGAAAPALGLLRGVAIQATDELLATPAAQRLWVEANRAAHSRFLELVEGKETGLIQSSDGDVTLELQPLIDRLRGRLGLPPGEPNPRTSIVLLQSDQLSVATETVNLIRKLSALMVIAAVVLFAVGIWLAEGFRRRFLLVFSASVLGIGLLLVILRRLVGNAVIDALSDPVNREAVTEVWLIGTSLLRDIALGLVVYGAIGLFGAWLAGPSGPAVTVRRWISPAMRHPIPVHIAVVVLFAMVVAWAPGASPRRLIALLILLALVLAGAEYVRRMSLRENPPQESSPAPAPS